MYFVVRRGPDASNSLAFVDRYVPLTWTGKDAPNGTATELISTRITSRVTKTSIKNNTICSKVNMKTSKTISTTTPNYYRAVLRVLRIKQTGKHHSSEF